MKRADVDLRIILYAKYKTGLNEQVCMTSRRNGKGREFARALNMDQVNSCAIAW